MQSACVVLHCHLWSVRLYLILINDRIFGKNLLNVKISFDFSTLLSETSFEKELSGQKITKLIQ